MMRLVVISGSIGCGKSTVRHMMREKGVECVDMDEIGRAALQPGGACYAAVRKHFGESILDESDVQAGVAVPHIDRTKLTERMFANPADRRKIGGIMDSHVTLKMLKTLLALALRGVPMVLLEMPLLFEFGLNKILFSAVVSVPPEQQLKRLMARNEIPEEDALRRIAAQYPLAKKVAAAHWVIDNSGTLEDLQREVDRVLDQWRRTHHWKMYTFQLLLLVFVLLVLLVVFVLYLLLSLLYSLIA
eukprot:TRINITY_DN5434_c0_g1_i1.p1 TRINITY_DN5434_c0_g1~~TRINITY_DN5434_c0_g1_i1.p1  ORF type:complete len:245 (+),score=82.74 TRINITY_DN5434_c0_g1_i1:198-932(+)